MPSAEMTLRFLFERLRDQEPIEGIQRTRRGALSPLLGRDNSA
jgi:hypothetical protein